MVDSGGPSPIHAPRYEVDEWGRRSLIADEAEWLARPARWVFWEAPPNVPYRKHALFDHHFYGAAAKLLNCETCGSMIASFFSEEGGYFAPNLPDTLSVFRSRHLEKHLTLICPGVRVARRVIQYKMGIVTEQEVYNWLVEGLEPLARQHGAAAEWERALSLELLGPNPFRPVVLDHIWRTDTTTGLADAMYESRSFANMPILADALEEAGCDQPDILAHCRDEAATHVRGCWVVDLVLGKE